jgi:hypothetical protein
LRDAARLELTLVAGELQLGLRLRRDRLRELRLDDADFERAPALLRSASCACAAFNCSSPGAPPAASCSDSSSKRGALAAMTWPRCTRSRSSRPATGERTWTYSPSTYPWYADVFSPEHAAARHASASNAARRAISLSTGPQGVMVIALRNETDRRKYRGREVQFAAMNVEQARFNMVEQQIRPWEVLDPDVLACSSR